MWKKECSPTEYEQAEDRYFDEISKINKKLVHISQSCQLPWEVEIIQQAYIEKLVLLHLTAIAAFMGDCKT